MIADPLLLSRIQFAANITFHYIFPSITIGLSWILLFFKLSFHKTQNTMWMDCYRFWVKIFALCFALGVVSGITMSFQFGTNWPGFMEKVGNVAGPLLGYEVLTAFFLEATFLGIMLFGINRVSPWVHTLATFFVAGGTALSSFWIISLNSWMQTPIGFEMIDGVAHATSWYEIVFNPSFIYRFTHTLIGSALTASFFVAGISAYKLLMDKTCTYNHKSLKLGLIIAAMLSPTQLIVGDLHGLNTLEHQPAKIAAIEGLWHTQPRAPLVLFGIPDPKTQSNKLSIQIPGLASLILTHDIDGVVKGINDFKDNHPPVPQVFYAFRIMVSLGLLMILMSWVGIFYVRKQKETYPSWFLKGLKYMTFSGVIASLSGWYVTEIGRQPWLVYNVLKTKDAVSKIAPSVVTLSFMAYMIIYAVLLFSFYRVIFYLARKY